MDTALRDELFQVLAAKGAKLMGVGDLSGIVDGELTTGVSVAVPLPTHVVQDLQTAPTEEYYHLYHSLNAQLNIRRWPPGPAWDGLGRAVCW